jgi:hypothetical protein
MRTYKGELFIDDLRAKTHRGQAAADDSGAVPTAAFIPAVPALAGAPQGDN